MLDIDRIACYISGMDKIITCGKCGQAHTVTGTSPRRGKRRGVKSAFVLSDSDKIYCSCGCELWKWGASKGGYAQTEHLGNKEYVTRILLGIVGTREQANHHCDNPRCVRRDHLYIGTQVDNVRDMHKRGRDSNGDQQGERNGYAKIADIDIPIIRARYASGELQKDIALDYGVSASQIGNIVHYRQRR